MHDRLGTRRADFPRPCPTARGRGSAVGDPDAWLAKPQPTPELCRLYHGIDCRRCVDGFDLCDKLVTIEEHHNADAWRRAADERALRLAEFYRRTTRQPEPGKGE